MATKLTAGVLNGTGHVETFKFEWEGTEYEIDIHPLDNTEAAEIEAMSQEGLSMTGRQGAKGQMQREMDFDNRKNTLARYKANMKCVVWGTVDKSISEKVVENEFSPAVVRKIATRIRQITGLAAGSNEAGGAEQLEQFPGDDE